MRGQPGKPGLVLAHSTSESLRSNTSQVGGGDRGCSWLRHCTSGHTPSRASIPLTSAHSSGIDWSDGSSKIGLWSSSPCLWQCGSSRSNVSRHASEGLWSRGSWIGIHPGPSAAHTTNSSGVWVHGISSHIHIGGCRLWVVVYGHSPG